MSVPAHIQSLINARAGFAARIEDAATDLTAPGGKPNNGSEGGGTDHMGALNTWLNAMAMIDKKLAELGYDANGNPVSDEIITEAYT